MALRPWQWVKNLCVLAPLLFSQNLLVPWAAARAVGTLLLFCLVSSAVYLLNDLYDYEQDRRHPQKRFRPIAADELSKQVAVVVMLARLFLAMAGGVLLTAPLALILFGYWLINLLYSAWLKHEVILDVFVLSASFVLRVVGGAVAIQVEMSHWLLLCTALLALFLGFSKRRHEVVLLGDEAEASRQVLGEYSPHFLDMMISVVTASTTMSYALYTVSEDTLRRFHTRALLLTFPFVLYGIFRYLYLVYQKDLVGDPTQHLLADRPLLINLCLWAALVGVILYWQ